MEFDPQEFVEEYREEARRHLQTLTEGLLGMEDSQTPDNADEMLRAAHTIKGSSRMLGFEEAGDAAHKLEDDLQDLRDGRLQASPEVVDGLLRQTDQLAARIFGVGHLMDVPATEPEEIEEPAAEEPVAEKPAVEWPGREEEPVAASEGAGRGAANGGASVRVRAEKLDRLAGLVDEVVVREERSSSRRLEELEELARRVARGGSPDGADRRAASEKLYGEARELRVAAESDELVAKTLAEELKTSVGGIRTLPLSTVFAPLPRLARDTARERGREVELVTEGGDVELDRAILESLGEPLGHLVRNAVDHGIEPPEERGRRGKPRRGRVTVSASYAGGAVEVTVTDDGRGLDEEFLRRRAAERGFDPELGADLIFVPGFSTAGEVTGVSGRGVGLDAVRSRIAVTGGSVRVEGGAEDGAEGGAGGGAGTTFTLRLPLTLGLTRVILVKCGPETYALPTATIEEIIKPGAISSVGGREHLDYEGEMVPVVRLTRTLGARQEAEPRLAAIMKWTRRVAVLLDDVVEEMEVSLKGLRPLLSGVPGVSGYTMLGAGQVVVVLDAAYLAGSATSFAGATAPEPKREIVKRLLLADDSSATRSMLRNFLEREGYEVVAVADGREAMEALRSRDVDGVVTDVEMPEMDGIELTGRIRAEENLRLLPVIIISARGEEEDVRRGVDAGADGYIVKRDFTPERFVDMVKRFVG